MCIRCAGGFHALALEMDEKFLFFIYFYINNYNILLISQLELFYPKFPSTLCMVEKLYCRSWSNELSLFEPFGHDTFDLFTLF